MKAEIWKTLENEQLVLCGDGRNDSPGHSAKHCVYVLMEQFLNIIVDIEVKDKRQTGGVLTNIEVYTLKRLLERIVGKLLVTEIVTDASAAVMKLVRDMKGNFSRIYLTTSNKYINTGVAGNFPLPTFLRNLARVIGIWREGQIS